MLLYLLCNSLAVTQYLTGALQTLLAGNSSSAVLAPAPTLASSAVDLQVVGRYILPFISVTIMESTV